MGKIKIRISWRKFHKKHLEHRKLKFVQWLDTKFPGRYCWADCVTWAIATNRINPFKIDRSKSCEIESKDHQCLSCYCGAWREGKCFDLLPKAERQRIEAERISNWESVKQELPF